jgi:hypothetical protein
MLWLQFSAIYAKSWRKMAFFSKTNVVIKFCKEYLAVCSSSKNAHFFAKYFRVKIFVNHNSDVTV